MSSFPNNNPEKNPKNKQTKDFTTETVTPYNTDKEYLFR